MNLRIRRKVAILAAVTLPVVVGCQTVHCTDDTQAQAAVEVNKQMVQILQEIVSLREAVLKEQRLLAELGRGYSGLVEAEVQLADARIRLATAQHQPEAAIQLRQELAAVLDEIVKDLQLRSADGRITRAGVMSVQIELAEARLRLLAATSE